MHRVDCRLRRHIGGKSFGISWYPRIECALVHLPSRLPGQQARRFVVDRHISDLVAHRLMLINRQAKGFSLARIFDALFQRAPLQTTGGGRHPRATEIEYLHRDVETLPDLADDILFRRLDIFEDDLRGIRRPLTQLVEFLADAQSRAVAIHDETGHAAMTRGRIRLGEYRIEMRVAGVGDECLAPVNDVGGALLVRARLNARHIGAGVGFGHAIGTELALLAGPFAQPVGFLLVAASDQNRQHRQGIDAQARADAGAAITQLLRYQRLFKTRRADAAVCFRNEHVYNAEFTRLMEYLFGEYRLLVKFGRDRDDVVSHKIARHPHQHVLLFAQFELRTRQ